MAITLALQGFSTSSIDTTYTALSTWWTSWTIGACSILVMIFYMLFKEYLCLGHRDHFCLLWSLDVLNVRGWKLHVLYLWKTWMTIIMHMWSRSYLLWLDISPRVHTMMNSTMSITCMGYVWWCIAHNSSIHCIETTTITYVSCW